MNEANACHHLEQLASYMRKATGAAGAHNDLAGIGLGVLAKLANRSGRTLGMDNDNTRGHCNAGDWRNITDRIVSEGLIKRCIDRVCGGGDEQRVPVRRCADIRFGSEACSGAQAIFYNEGLTKPLRQSLSNQSCDKV